MRKPGATQTIHGVGATFHNAKPSTVVNMEFHRRNANAVGTNAGSGLIARPTPAVAHGVTAGKTDRKSAKPRLRILTT